MRSRLLENLLLEEHGGGGSYILKILTILPAEYHMFRMLKLMTSGVYSVKTILTIL